MDGAELGRALRARRTATGRTIADVATAAGLSVPYIANLENGRGNPTLGALRALADALGTPLRVSLGDAGTTDPPALPASLTRYTRTARFAADVERLATAHRVSPDELRRRLTYALAGMATLAPAEPTERDWNRLLDAVLLVALHS